LSAAEAVVQRQLDAYAARDLDAFMACWADDALYYFFPDQLIAQGAAAIRAYYAPRIVEPHLSSTLLARTSVENLVVDRQRATHATRKGTYEIETLAMYEVTGEKIARAWFKIGTPQKIAYAVSPYLRPGASTKCSSAAVKASMSRMISVRSVLHVSPCS
jgi:putative hydrolase of HD superfamily